MFKKITSILLAAALAGSLVFGGCKKSDDTQIKTQAEYEADAEKEINADNMEEELANIEKALEQDIDLE